MANQEAVGHQDNSVVVFDRVNKFFGSHQVLFDITTEIYAGETVVLLGPSGSGKSTMLRCINGLEKVQSGRLQVLGYDLTDPNTDMKELSAQIGMVFQSFNLYPHMTVLDNITLAPRRVLKLIEPLLRKGDISSWSELGFPTRPTPIQ